MKIQGVLTLEGLNLHVDIDVDDRETDVYVTSVWPTCVVIPRERWKIEFLSLPPEVLKVLHEHGLTTLDSLVDANWDLKALGLPEAIAKELATAVEQFRQMALLFKRVERYRDPLGPEIADVSDVLTGAPTKPAAVNNDITVCELTPFQERMLRNKGLVTLADIVTRGPSRLVMLPGFDAKAIAKIELALVTHGFELPGKSQTPA